MSLSTLSSIEMVKGVLVELTYVASQVPRYILYGEIKLRGSSHDNIILGNNANHIILLVECRLRNR